MTEQASTTRGVMLKFQIAVRPFYEPVKRFYMQVSEWIFWQGKNEKVPDRTFNSFRFYYISPLTTRFSGIAPFN